MADVVFVAIAVAFFAVCVLYIRGCERILRGGEDSAQSSDIRDEMTA